MTQSVSNYVHDNARQWTRNKFKYYNPPMR